MTVRRDAARPQRPWVIDIPYRTPDGKRRRYRRDAQVQTRTGAEAEHRRLLSQLAQHGELIAVAPAPTKTTTHTVHDAISHYRRAVGPTLKPSTLQGYEEIFNAVLLERWSDLHLSELGPTELRQLDADLAAAGLSPSRRRNIQVAARSVLRAAARDGLLEQMPELPRLPKVGKTCRQAMLINHVEAVLAKATDAGKLAFSLIAFAGLRPCEVRGLRWPDVDLDEGTIRVRRGLYGGVESPPKSGHQREVPMAARLDPLLRAAQAKLPNPWAYVALSGKQKPWGQTGLYQAFARTLSKTSYSGWTLYDLRHFFVSELLRQGAPANVVRELAGHEDLSTTQRYAHSVATDRRGAIDRLGGNSVEMAPAAVE